MSDTAPSKFDELVQSMQRDFNCLSDSNRATRTGGLDRIKRKLLPFDSKLNAWSYLKDMSTEERCGTIIPILDRLFQEHLSPLLLKLFDDSSEACRTSAMDLFLNICKQLPQSFIHLPSVASIAARRIAAPQQLESTEELRLALTQLMNFLLQSAIGCKADDVLARSVDDVVASTNRALGDAFPDLKKECCQTVLLLTSIADNLPIDSAFSSCKMDTYHSTLAQSATANLGHQRNQIRLAALQAVGALLLADKRYSGGGIRAWAEPLLPALMQLTNDRTPSVRQELVKVSLSLLEGLRSMEPAHRARILMLLLSGVADPTESIAAESTAALNRLGALLDPSNVSGSDVPITASIAGARRLVCSVLGELVQMLLLDLSDWTAGRRLRGAALLSAAVRYASGASVGSTDSEMSGDVMDVDDGIDGRRLLPHLPALLPALARCVHDDDTGVARQISECCALIGVHLQASACLPYLYAAIGLGPEPAALSDPSRTQHSWVSLHSAAATSTSTTTSMIASSTSSMQRQSESASRSPVSIGVHQLANALAVLAGMLKGWACRPNDAEMPVVVSELMKNMSHSELCCHDNAAVRQHVLTVVKNSLELPAFAQQTNSSAAPSSVEAHAFWALLQLDALAEDAEMSQIIFAVLEALANRCGHSSTDALFAVHLRACLRLICESAFITLPDSHYVAPLPNYYDFVGPNTNLEKDAETTPVADHGVTSVCSNWQAQSPQRLLFSSLCRRSVGSVDSALDDVLPVLASCAHPDADKTLRISAIALAEYLIRMSAQHAAQISEQAFNLSNRRWGMWVDFVTREVVLPAIVWRAGRVATSLRLQGFMALNSMFARGLFTPALLSLDTLLPTMLPLLVSSLDDYDPRVRMQACKALRSFLQITEAKIDEMQITNLYRELLKRLDDSSDDIRLDACLAMCQYVRVVPQDYDRTHYKYLLRGLLVHLDDTNSKIQEGVFEVLCAFRFFDPVIFFTEVNSVRDKHSSPVHCDRLLQLAPNL